jgi:hypothetical protein
VVNQLRFITGLRTATNQLPSATFRLRYVGAIYGQTFRDIENGLVVGIQRTHFDRGTLAMPTLVEVEGLSRIRHDGTQTQLESEQGKRQCEVENELGL